MKKTSFYLKSNSDDLNIYTTIFEPDNIKGIIQFAHGMVEHQIYYYELMEILCNHGYVCVINDHRGHGKSIKDEKDLGYFYEEKAEYIVEDMHQITLLVKEKYPNVPVFLFGHSMGSLIVRKYIKKYDNEIDKLIVCGSPSINPMSRPGHLITKLDKILKGDHYRSRFLNGLALTNDTSSNWLTINEEYVSQYNKDKYCNYIFTTNGFINLTQLMIDVYSKKDWCLNNKDLPIFFIAGEDDMVIQGEKQFLKSINFLKHIGYKNITYKLYPHLKHAIFKDDVDIVSRDILNFIKM